MPWSWHENPVAQNRPCGMLHVYVHALFSQMYSAQSVGAVHASPSAPGGSFSSKKHTSPSPTMLRHVMPSGQPDAHGCEQNFTRGSSSHETHIPDMHCVSPRQISPRFCVGQSM